MVKEEVKLAIHSSGLDHYPGVAFIANRDTHQVLFLNQKGKELFHVSQEDIAKGITCDSIGLHNLELCLNCPINKLEENTFYNLRNYNKKVGLYFNYLIYPYQKNGQKLFISFARDNSAEVKIRVEAKKEEVAEQALNDALIHSMNQGNPNEAILTFLKEIAHAFKGSRCFVFEKMPDGGFTNTYFWSARKEEKNVPDFNAYDYGTFFDVLYQSFDENKEIFVDDLSDYPTRFPEFYHLLEKYPTKSFLVKPICYNGKKLGHFGMSDITREDYQQLRGIINTVPNVLGLLLLQRESQKKMYSLIYEDPLTKVKNRHGLDQFLEKKKKPVTYFYADINGLKETNDQLGHQKGDKLVQNCANILVSHFGKDNVYRMGGDEFLAISPLMEQEKAEELISAIKNEVHAINASMALSTLSEKKGNENFDKNFVVLDRRMYEDKKRHHLKHPYEQPHRIEEP